MVLVILGTVFAVAGFMMGFGGSGNGTQSRNISNLAGIIWLIAIIYAFVTGGIKFGLLVVLLSFVVSAITMQIGKAVIGNMRGKL